ncbi:REP-associated tyrosine transposase [Yoonia sp.]|uniref:REP-associated tyrosine transposase n=1 Tax=Yoonia sp. TaxID=2212373 RepID=UPI00391B5233
MSKYIRRHVPGGTYFFTVCLQDQRSDLLIRQIALLRDATRLCQKQMPFRIDAAVILPAELHMIWTLPDGDSDYSGRWRMIKSTFSRHLPIPATRTRVQARRHEKGIWQRRFRKHVIRDESDLALHMHLIVTAPLRAGLVRRAGDWPYASWHHRADTIPRIRTIAPVPSSPDPAIAAPAR